MSDSQQTNVPARSERTAGKSLLAAALTLLSIIYLINPGAGVFEFLPDNIPFVGNLDEATATAVLLSSLAYFGIELPWLRRR
ncbi:MAG: DUF1232 domain-containing protein [Planctomycetaceae bacterium]